MNKEQQELLDGAYENYLKGGHIKWLNQMEVNTPAGKMNIPIPYTPKEFINKCKTDSEFSQRWGLKIDERELDMMERWKIADLTPNMEEFDFANYMCDKYNVPTKLITITYNDKIVERYE
jgi:hypothetical protein